MRRAHVYPRVSEHMEEIIETVKALIDRGYAYEMDGDVYYSVEKFDITVNFPGVIWKI